MTAMTKTLTVGMSQKPRRRHSSQLSVTPASPESLGPNFQKLSTQPLLGKAVEEIAPNLRFIPIGSYLVFYRAIEDGVEIVRILHGARDITAEFSRAWFFPASFRERWKARLRPQLSV